MQVYEPEEEIFQVDVYPDAIVFSNRLEKTEQPEKQTPGWLFGCIILLACLLPLTAIVGQVYLATHPFTATVLVQAQQVSSLAHIYQLPPITDTQSQVVVATGHKHTPATQGHGYITFYNGLTQAQTIAAGELLTGSDGEEVVTDQDVTIPAGTLSTNGTASVGAHALDYGPVGNIRAGDIYGPCCRAWIKVVNAAFTGGQSARDYQLLTKADIDTAKASLLAQENPALKYSISPGETLLTPVPCKTVTSSNHKAGDEVAQVRVTVVQTCHPTAYKPGDIQRMLLKLVAGREKGDALKSLLALPGIRTASISWADDMRLPKDARYIRLVILI